jgi:hypothetical protein
MVPELHHEAHEAQCEEPSDNGQRYEDEQPNYPWDRPEAEQAERPEEKGEDEASVGAPGGNLHPAQGEGVDLYREGPGLLVGEPVDEEVGVEVSKRGCGCFEVGGCSADGPALQEARYLAPHACRSSAASSS